MRFSPRSLYITLYMYTVLFDLNKQKKKKKRLFGFFLFFFFFSLWILANKIVWVSIFSFRSTSINIFLGAPPPKKKKKKVRVKDVSSSFFFLHKTTMGSPQYVLCQSFLPCSSSKVLYYILLVVYLFYISEEAKSL